MRKADNFDLKKFITEGHLLKEDKISKDKILKMSDEDLKSQYGVLNVKGEYGGKKGTFHHFKKVMGKIVCSFRTDESTPSGLKKNIQALKVNDPLVKF
jgi:hypothetical protein